jgi:formate-dependent nitrite reductase cytochrome c552 subunit
MVRVSGREYNGLLESPCFKSNAQLSCFSCHTMHQPAADPRPTAQWADDQLTAGMDGNQACLQCHATFRTNLSAHTRHQSNSSGSSCYNCHMPYTTYGLLKTIRSHTISNPSATESVDAGRPNACNLCHLDKTLAWTAETLSRWYGTPGVQLSADDQTIAASLQWLLKGDAGQRAIAAQAMGWPAAREASGTDWMAPHLATLLDDPYDAVRFIAARSLRSLPGMTGLHYDFVAPSPVRRKSQLQTMALWDGSRRRPGRAEAQLLMTSAGDVDIETVLRLLKERDNRRMLLRE